MDHWRDVAVRAIVGVDMKRAPTTRDLEPHVCFRRAATRMVSLAAVLASAIAPVGSSACSCASAPTSATPRLLPLLI